MRLSLTTRKSSDVPIKFCLKGYVIKYGQEPIGFVILTLNSFSSARGTLKVGVAECRYITTLTGSGWIQQNNSSPVGSDSWFQGNSSVFPAQSGAASSYIGANFNNTLGGGTISNWLITPLLNLQNGDTFSFFTRTVGSPVTPDRLEVRLSTNGGASAGSTETSVGDFSTLLLSINPTLTTTGYPNSWTQYNLTVSGLGAPASGRLAFRYFVTNGGSGNNSDYIGIDTFSYTAVPTPALLPGLIGIGIGVLRKRKEDSILTSEDA